ncbi:MAG: hypothetical protein AB8G05_21470 [Oligoflexales bacterium]
MQDYNYGVGNGNVIDKETEISLTNKFNLPPDPGKKGTETLMGVDSNNDGLRDDVQRWIYFNYPDEPLVRKALIQVAIDRMENFRYINDKEESIKASHKSGNSGNCLFHVVSLVNLKIISF